MATGLTAPLEAPTQAPAPTPTERPRWHFYCCPTTPAVALCGHNKPPKRGRWTASTQYESDDCSACVLEHQQWRQQPWNEHHWSCPNNPPR